MSAGAVQRKSRLLEEDAPAVTAAGAPGGSSTLVTSIVTSSVASIVAVVSGLPPASSPSLTPTVTA